MRVPPFSAAVILVILTFAGCEDSTSVVPSDLSLYRHVRPFWSPTSDRVGFTNNHYASAGIWSVDTSGSNLQLIHAGDVGGGTWSPDGQWVAFFEFDLIKARKVGADSVKVLVTIGGSIRPAWSPDGRTLAFVRVGIMTLDLASGVESFVSTTGSYAQWFPGTRSLLIGTPYAEAGQVAYLLQRAQPDSALIQDLAILRTPDDCSFFVPSPDGSTVFFSRRAVDERSQVWSLTLSTRQLRQLTVDGGDYPAVSPNGMWVAYTRTAPDDGGLWLMRQDGTGKHRLTTPEP